MKYAFFDGDNVGNSIEILLRESRIAEATDLSFKIKVAFSEIVSKLETLENVEIVIAAGDDLLIEYHAKSSDNELLEEIRGKFQKITGLSLSCGIGDTVPQSVQNLYLAKLYGKNQIRG